VTKFGDSDFFTLTNPWQTLLWWTKMNLLHVVHWKWFKLRAMCQVEVAPRFLYLPELFRLCNSTSTKWLPRLGPKLVPFILFMVLNFQQPSIFFFFYFIFMEWNKEYIKLLSSMIMSRNNNGGELINKFPFMGSDRMSGTILNFGARAVSKSPYSPPASCNLSRLLTMMFFFVINYEYKS